MGRYEDRHQTAADEQRLWETLLRYQGESFYTAKGLAYTYTIKGNEMFCTRKEKSITRATVDMALKRVEEMRVAQGAAVPLVTGPKKLDCFGASYLYPILIRIGWIRAE